MLKETTLQCEHLEKFSPRFQSSSWFVIRVNLLHSCSFWIINIFLVFSILVVSYFSCSSIFKVILQVAKNNSKYRTILQTRFSENLFGKFPDSQTLEPRKKKRDFPRLSLAVCLGYVTEMN